VVKNYRKVIDERRRGLVMTSLGCHAVGAALPHPDPCHRDTMIAGVRKRAGFAPPIPDYKLLDEFGVFVEKWCKTNLQPLAPTSDVSVPTWLSKTNYPFHRREELQQKWDSIIDSWEMEERYYRCKSFMKDECYPEYKHARGINSRSDEFKCRVGPVFKLIEEQLYKHPSFIKHVPVKDRPKYILDMLYNPASKYAATDYTAFESLFTALMMEKCEFILYSYMTKFLPCHDGFMRLCRKVLAGTNECYYRDFSMQIEATRMSGEMCTSLGNGFTNLMAMFFFMF